MGQAGMGHAEGALGRVEAGDSMTHDAHYTPQASTPNFGVGLAELPQGRHSCLEKALVLKFTLTSDVQALYTQAGGCVMEVPSVNE